MIQPFLVPQKTVVSVETEFCHIQDWAKDNSMIINLAKSKEIVCYNPRATPTFILSPIFGIERVSSVTKISVVKCILNTLSLFQVRDFIHLRL